MFNDRNGSWVRKHRGAGRRRRILIGSTIAGAALLLLLTPSSVQAQAANVSTTATAPAKKLSAISLSGVVVDHASGRPLAGVKVRVKRYGQYWKTSGKQGLSPDAVTTHVTNAEGRYSFDVATAPSDDGSPAKDFALSFDAEHADYLPCGNIGCNYESILEAHAAGERLFFEKIELRQGEAVTGTIVDPAGRPLAGAEVQATSSSELDQSLSSDAHIVPSKAITDAQGRFRVLGFPTADLKLTATSKGYAIFARALGRERGDLGEVRLQAGVRLNGRVLDRDGKPVVGVPVWAGTDSQKAYRADVVGVQRYARTDAAGRFALDPLPPGEFYVEPLSESYDEETEVSTHYTLPGVYTRQEVSLANNGGSHSVDLRPLDSVALRVQFRNSAGDPIAPSAFSVYGSLKGIDWSEMVDKFPNGEAKLDVPRGLTECHLNIFGRSIDVIDMFRYRLRPGDSVQALGHRGQHISLGTMDEAMLDVELFCSKAARLTVFLIDEQGRPVDDGDVKIKYVRKTTVDWALFVNAAPKLGAGRYQTDYLLAGEELKLTARAEGYLPAELTVTTAEGEMPEVKITLKRPSHRKRS